jgi:hypothetical protein
MAFRAVLSIWNKNIFHLSGIEPRFLVRPSHSPVTVPIILLLQIYCVFSFFIKTILRTMTKYLWRNVLTGWHVTTSPQLTSAHVVTYPNFGMEVASFLNCQAVRNVGRSQGGVASLSSQVQGHVFVGHSNAGGLENTLQSVTQFHADRRKPSCSPSCEALSGTILVKQFVSIQFA